MTKTKSEDWFNDKYSDKKDMNIIGSKNLKLEGSLKIKEFSKLISISLEKIELTNLYISGCSQLTKVDLSRLPKLKSLSVTKCPNLTTLNCSSTGLTSLEIRDCSQLQEFDLSKLPKLTSLSVTDCRKLTGLDCSSPELINLEISDSSQFEKFDLSKLPKLKSLSVTKCSNLTTLNFSSTGLTSLEINDCSQLKEIGLSKLPKLTSLSVAKCPNIATLNCSTGLTSLEIINCSQLRITDSFKFKHKSLYVRGYSNLSDLDCLEAGFNSLKISNCSQLNEIDLSKLPKITSLSVIDCSKLTKIDCSSTGLTCLKVSGCYNLKKIDLSNLPELTSLSVIDCLSLTNLDCSNNSKLNDLEVSDLTELNCSNTSIEELSLNLCPYITKLDCSKNDKLINLDVSNCFELESIVCSQSKLTSLDLRYCPNAVVDRSDLDIKREKENIKNILIVGRTGSGKSTLANVLTNSDDFKESEYAVSETKFFRKKEFKGNITHFRVVDTIGVGNTRLDLNDVLYRIADGVYAMPEGISQILYVVDGRSTEEEINTFNMIKHILEINIFGYVTLVRTKFEKFRSKEGCNLSIKKMRETIAEIVESCNDVIHVDNPPTNVVKDDDGGDDDRNVQISVNKSVRKKSRKILLDYLENVRPVKEDVPFKLKTWDNLHDSILKYVKTEEDTRKRLESDPELKAFYETAELCLIL
jgi:Leucine-rich repeat (LRR) protein